MLVKQFGLAKADELPLQTYSEASRPDSFTINSGDPEGILKGTRLEEVASLELNGAHFLPAGLVHAGQKDELRLSSADVVAVAGLRPDEKAAAHVTLKDGRLLDVQATVEPPRSKVTLISKSVQPAPNSTPSSIRLANQDDIPQDGQLSFFLKAQVPATFAGTEKIEVATANESFHVLLSLADGNLVLQDPQTVLAMVNPLKSLGPSAFGPLRFRPVNSDGAGGDWQPLANVVRVPSLKEIRCPDNPDKQCTLAGTNLFLIDSVDSDPHFAHAVSVPIGFADSNLRVPRPNGTLLYLKLRDDPTAVNVAVLPVLPERP